MIRLNNLVNFLVFLLFLLAVTGLPDLRPALDSVTRSGLCKPPSQTLFDARLARHPLLPFSAFFSAAFLQLCFFAFLHSTSLLCV